MKSTALSNLHPNQPLFGVGWFFQPGPGNCYNGVIPSPCPCYPSLLEFVYNNAVPTD